MLILTLTLAHDVCDHVQVNVAPVAADQTKRDVRSTLHRHAYPPLVFLHGDTCNLIVAYRTQGRLPASHMVC